jgi:hypothetical protein
MMTMMGLICVATAIVFSVPGIERALDRIAKALEDRNRGGR